jgi:hypothetical protein
MITVNEREFYIWKLEWWYVAFDKAEFYPEDRIHLFKNVFWRK